MSDNPNNSKDTSDCAIEPERSLAMILHHEIIQDIVDVIIDVIREPRYKKIIENKH